MTEPSEQAAAGSPRSFAFLSRLPHPIRYVTVFLLGGFLISVGILLLVLPGPGIVMIALGLAVWATEFEWAAKTLRRSRETGTSAYRWGRNRMTKGKGTYDG